MIRNLKSGNAFVGDALLFFRVLLLSGWISPGFLMTVTAQTYTPPANNRVDINLDSGWRFIQQNVSGAQATNFDDSSWTNVNLPHTWDIPDGQSYPPSNYYTGISWYRTHFTPDASYTNSHFFVKFDGAFRVADV
jgi:beta-galactosidase